MTIASKKKIAWGMMSGGAGAILLFGAVIWLNGRGLERHEYPAYAWPVVAAAVVRIGWVWLRALYRIEPPVPPAAWTVSLADLIFATVFAGVWGSVAASNERYAMLTPMAALTGFALYLGSSLAASLHGIVNTAWRPVYVVSHAFATLGFMGVLSLMLVMFIFPLVASGSELFEFLGNLTEIDGARKEWMVILQLMLLALPLGIVALVVLNAIGVGKKDGAAP